MYSVIELPSIVLQVMYRGFTLTLDYFGRNGRIQRTSGSTQSDAVTYGPKENSVRNAL